jgi:hypothetical protein
MKAETSQKVKRCMKFIEDELSAEGWLNGVWQMLVADRRNPRSEAVGTPSLPLLWHSSSN